MHSFSPFVITPSEVLATIEEFVVRFPDSYGEIKDLIEQINRGINVLDRKMFVGHITCAAVVYDRSGRILLVQKPSMRHRLLPGGHIEKEDASLQDAARRELKEETGISEVESVDDWNQVPLVIDRHKILANEGKGEPQHDHWDFRFLFRTSQHKVNLNKSELVAFGWVQPREHSARLTHALGGVPGLRIRR